MPGAKSQDWVRLQRLIFTRWVNMKLAGAKEPEITDVVDDLKDGRTLAKLVQSLSEVKYPKKLKEEKSRIKVIAQAGNVVKWVYDQGVELKLKTSAEDLVDSNERPIMALIWAIIIRFSKFNEGEDDEDEASLNAEDSLKMWVNNQLISYGIKVKKFDKSFVSGKAFAALIHKNRPQFIDPAALSESKDDYVANMTLVMAAAGRYFDLPQYLKPAEFSALDAKSAFVFVSEFYYGIANQRKVDLACRRIEKLAAFTIYNDALRADFTEKATALDKWLNETTTMLNDRTIDNNMAGARRRIDEFNDWKSTTKPQIVDNFLKIETVYNHLAMRLAEHKRPVFAPPRSVANFNEALKALEVTEQERQIALVAELNRQIKLAALNTQHQARFDKISAWSTEKDAYVTTKEDNQTSGQADFQINRLQTFNKELSDVSSSQAAALSALAQQLISESYENSDSVNEREASVAAALAKLTADSASKMEILQDDKARLLVREATHLLALKHKAQCTGLTQWCATQTKYLKSEPAINSISDASLQISIFEGYVSEREANYVANVPPFKATGASVLAAKYESKHSSWTFESPDDITGAESTIDSGFAALDDYANNTKKPALDAALANEIEKERLRLLFAGQAQEHTRRATSACDDMKASHFGFNLEEVEAYQATIEGEDSACSASDAASSEAATATFNAAAELGVTENIYTTLTLADLTAASDSLAAGQADRQARYAAELQRQRDNDALCKAFAGLAEPFVANVQKVKETVTNSQDSAEDQLAYVDAQMAEDASASAGALGAIAGAQSAIDEAKVQYNPHSNYTGADVSVIGTQFTAFLTSKKSQLADEIKNKEMRGLTQEQFDEIESQFRQFDKDSSNTLTLNELRSCLYSLGEEKRKDEVKEIMVKFSNDGGTNMDLAGFQNFMIEYWGDSDTKDEVHAGFGLINKNRDVFVHALAAETALSADTIAYIEGSAPKSGDDWDYSAWTEDQFSR